MNHHLLAAEAYDIGRDTPFRRDPRVRGALGSIGTTGMVSAHIEIEDGREVCVVGTDRPNPWIGYQSNCLGVDRQQPIEIERWEFDDPGPPPNPQAAASHLYRMLVPLPEGAPPPPPASRGSRWRRFLGGS